MATTGNFDVTVVGSCMIDLVSRAPRLPKPGETLRGTKFFRGYGGKGANQAVCASRLGSKTAMIARVGSDVFGEEYLRNFEDNSVDTSWVMTTKGDSTGVAPIIVDQNGQNSIIIIPGANDKLTTRDVYAAVPAIISISKVLVCQLEISVETSLYALKMGGDNGAITILNPAPAVEKLNTELFQYSDFIIPNETEAEILTGCRVTTLDEARTAANALRAKGCNNVIITLGERGALFLGKQCKSSFHVPIPSISQDLVIDTTGAGDAFVGSFAHYISTLSVEQRDNCDAIREIIQKACAVATYSVQRDGTQASFPHPSDILPSSIHALSL